MRDYLTKLVYHSNSKRGNRRGGSPGRQQVPPERGEMAEDIEKKKDYLKQYGKAVRQMARSELIINELRMNKMHPSLILDGSPRGSSQADLSAYAAKMEEETERYLKARYHRIRLCTEIRDKIETIADEDEKDILTYRYIKLLRWSGSGSISEKMKMSVREVHRLHGRALLHFEI